jgi:prevent-host-death family protein
MIMKESVRIAELKSRLSEYLRKVRAGRVLTIYDRDTPIARLVPIEGASLLTVRPPSAEAKGLARVALPPPLEVGVDVVDVLAEERGER